MNRLTQKRVNGIKTGYWSTSKKDDLVARLAEYEDTGLEPAEVLQLKKNTVQWIPVAERMPERNKSVLLCMKSRPSRNGMCMQTGSYDTVSGLCRAQQDMRAWQHLSFTCWPGCHCRIRTGRNKQYELDCYGER